jgi:multiple sugar transport system substrate-binding protein
MAELTEKGKLIGGEQLADMLKNSAKPVFPEGAPSWYPEFSRTVYTNLHAAAAGSMTVPDAIKAIADQANKLAAGS